MILCLSMDQGKSYRWTYIQRTILDISVNMARVSKWVAESYEPHKKLIGIFMDQSERFLNELFTLKISKEFKPTLDIFKKEFDHLKRQTITDENKLHWAEKALTWANILQHRAKLA